MDQVLFTAFSALAVVAALLAVTRKNAVASACWLVAMFFGLAGVFVLQEAYFVATTQILVYAGAIMVLFLFVIMLLNLNKSAEPQKSVVTRIAAVVSGGVFLLTLLGAVRHGLGIAQPEAFDGGVGLVKSVGTALFTEFLVPFELSSVLFLAAMIGAMMLGQKEKLEVVNENKIVTP